MENTTPPLVEIENLTVSYRTRTRIVRAVTGFNLTINAGEKIGLAGESGCGKSTMAFALMNYLSRAGFIESGSMKFEGKSIAGFSESETQRFRGKDAAMVYQDPLTALNPCLRIKDQLIEVPLNHDPGVNKKEALDIARQSLEKVRLPVSKLLLDSYPHQLSGGQQQRIVIAMALMAKPKLLIMDEPTTALDVTVEAGIMRLVDEIVDELGTALLLISHNIDLLYRTCDRVGVMYSGKMVEYAMTDEIFKEPSHPYTRSLFDCIPLMSSHKYKRPLVPATGQPPAPWERPDGCVFSDRCQFFRPGTCDQQDIPSNKLSDTHFYLCAGYDPAAVKPRPPGKVPAAVEGEEKPILKISDLVRHYSSKKKMFQKLKPSVKALNGFTAELGKNSVLCVVGESGCGKSTMAKVIAGLEKSNSGEILSEDVNISKKLARERSPEMLRKIQMIFQNPNDTLNPKISIGKQVARNLVKLTGIRDKKVIRDTVIDLLERVKLPGEYYNYRPERLSGGQKQRVSISRAFISGPEIIIADEPVSALDVSVQAAVIELMLEMIEENRNSVIFISHDIALVKYLADEVIVMYLGHVMEKGKAAEVFSAPYHPYTEALFSAVPRVNQKMKDVKLLGEGEMPSSTNPPKGCPYSTRCDMKIGDICDRELPPLNSDPNGHAIRCHIPNKELAKTQSQTQIFAG